MDAGVLFSHDVAGFQTIELLANLQTATTKKVTYVCPTLAEAGISFSHDIAGKQTIGFSIGLSATPTEDEFLKVIESFPASISVSSLISHPFKLYRYFSSDIGISTGLSLSLNVGYTDVITFGSLTLNKAEPIDWDEIELSVREAKIWDGTTALDGDPVIGFYGTYRFWPRDWNDIESLLAMAGTKQTLRVYGKPYRNCMLVGKIRKKQIKKGYALWCVEIEIKQDTCMTGITA